MVLFELRGGENTRMITENVEKVIKSFISRERKNYSTIFYYTLHFTKMAKRCSNCKYHGYQKLLNC